MIDTKTLTTDDIGRSVTYHKEYYDTEQGALSSCNKYCETEHGTLSSWNDVFIFVIFKGPNCVACHPEDVTFDFGGRE